MIFGRDLIDDVIDRPAFFADAACREHPVAVFFPERGASIAAAKAICAGCLVRVECDQYADTVTPTAGVWAGMTARNRARRRTQQRHAA